MNKHSYCTLTAIILVLSLMLAGCGPQRGTVDPGTEPNTPEQGTIQPETTAPEVTEPVEDTPVSLGRMEGGTYTNTYAGIACDLDSTWTFYSAEELQELPQNVKELMEGTEVGDAATNLDQVTDMMAENADLLANVNVLYTKLDLKERLAYQILSEEEVLDSVLEGKDAIISSYTQAGMTVSSMEKVKVTFLGEEHWALKTSAVTQDVPHYILQVFNYQLGAYGVVLTCSSFVEDQTQAVLDLFYPVS